MTTPGETPGEERVRIGQRVWVDYLIHRIACVVTDIQVSPSDGQLYARCDAGNGDTRWELLEAVRTEERTTEEDTDRGDH